MFLSFRSRLRSLAAGALCRILGQALRKGALAMSEKPEVMACGRFRGCERLFRGVKPHSAIVFDRFCSLFYLFFFFGFGTRFRGVKPHSSLGIEAFEAAQEAQDELLRHLEVLLRSQHDFTRAKICEAGRTLLNCIDLLSIFRFLAFAIY